MQMISSLLTYQGHHSRNFLSLYIIIPISIKNKNKTSLTPNSACSNSSFLAFTKVFKITVYICFFSHSFLNLSNQVFASFPNHTMTSPKLFLSRSTITSSLINSMVSFQFSLFWLSSIFLLKYLLILAFTIFAWFSFNFLPPLFFAASSTSFWSPWPQRLSP